MRLSGIAGICIVVLSLAVASGASADWDNLLTNGSFSSGLSGWTASGAVTWDGSSGQPAGSALVAGTNWAKLQQTVVSDWTDGPGVTQYELKAKLRIYPEEDIHFDIGYWCDTQNPPAPGACPDYIVDLGHYTDTGQNWISICKSGYLDCQPKYLSVIVTWNPELNPHADCHGWVDQIEFRAKCVPEPSGLLALIPGLGGLAAFARRKRS